MKTKWMLIFALTFAYQTAPCQSQELSEEEFNEMSAFVHEMSGSLFQEKNYVYKEEPYEREDFYETYLKIDQIQVLLDLIRKNGKLSIEEGDYGLELLFKADVGEDYSDKISHIDKIEQKETKLVDQKGQPIPLQGYYQNYSFLEGVKYAARIDKDAYKPSGAISGSVSYNLQFLSGYDQVSLTRKNIGKTFTLNNCTFKLIDIVRNQVIIEPLCEEDISVKLINYAKENMVYTSYAWDELMEMKKKDPTINTDGSFTQSSQTMDKKIYETFKKNPKFSLKKFRKMLTTKEIERLSKQESSYLILEHVAPIGEKFVLFMPKFKSERVEIQY